MAEVTLKFGGVNNVLPPEVLGEYDDVRKPVLHRLTSALNVDIDDALGFAVREGFTEVLTSVPHSGWAVEGGNRAFFVEDGVLKEFLGSSSVDLLTLSSNRAMSYTQVNEVVVFSNRDEIGYIDSAGAALFSTPTDQFKRATPAGQALTFFNGSLWVANGDIVTRSDAYAIEQCDERFCDIPLPGQITLLHGVPSDVGGGLWVSYGNSTAFLRAGEEAFKLIAPYGAILGTAVAAKAEWFGVEGFSENVVVWRSDRGVCIGDSNGRFANLSEGRVSMKPGDTGAAIMRHSKGCVHYLSTVQGTHTEFNIYS